MKPMSPLSPEPAVPEAPRKRNWGPGIFLALLGCVLVGVAVLAAMVIPQMQKARASQRGRVCLANVKSLCLGLQTYAADHDDRLPPGARWMDDLVPYARNRRVLRCPGVSGPRGRSGYAMNRELSGRALDLFDRPDLVPAVFDSKDVGRHALGGLELLPSPPRHPGGNTIGYLDGHAMATSARGGKP